MSSDFEHEFARTNCLEQPVQKHKPQPDGHCAHPGCPNFFGHCPRHKRTRVPPPSTALCTREPLTQRQLLERFAHTVQRAGYGTLPYASASDRSYLGSLLGKNTYRSFFLPDGRLVVFTVDFVCRLLTAPSRKATQ